MTKNQEKFFNAALIYCAFWTKDMRNSNDPTKSRQKLDRARYNLYEAFKTLKKEEGCEIPSDC